MFIDVLTSLTAEISSLLGKPVAIALLILTCAALFLLCWFLAARLAESFVAPRPRPGKSSRAELLRKWSDEELKRRLKKHPGDEAALRESCRRLRKTHDRSALARDLEALFALEGSLQVEEQATVAHQLADLYLEPQGQCERSLEVLQTFANRFPGTRQADFALERIQRLKEQMGEKPGTEINPGAARGPS